MLYKLFWSITTKSYIYKRGAEHSLFTVPFICPLFQIQISGSESV